MGSPLGTDKICKIVLNDIIAEGQYTIPEHVYLSEELLSSGAPNKADLESKIPNKAVFKTDQNCSDNINCDQENYISENGIGAYPPINNESTIESHPPDNGKNDACILNINESLYMDSINIDTSTKGVDKLQPFNTDNINTGIKSIIELGSTVVKNYSFDRLHFYETNKKKSKYKK